MTAHAIGIDASLTHTGVVVLGARGEARTLALKPSKALRGVERLAWFRERFGELFAGQPDAHVALEGYAFGARNGREAAGELGGVVRLAVLDAGITGERFRVIPPTVLKKYVTGKGTADKAVMLLKVFQRWGFEADDHNIADAYALARFAQAAAQPVEAQSKGLRELLAKMAAPKQAKRKAA